MTYQVKRIKNRENITECERFDIRQYQWDHVYTPAAHGYMGYLEQEGLYVKMTCEEKNPRRECTEHRQKVCVDSAMEIFFAFTEDGEALSNDSMYINYEINSNGALYAAYGKGRKNRSFLSEELFKISAPSANIEEDHWNAEVLIPEVFLKEICDWEAVKAGKPFYFNFYKIAEAEEVLHFGTCYRIENETPNFHLPVFFGEAVIEEV